VNRLLKHLAELRRRQSAINEIQQARELDRWLHHRLFDPDGTRLGHVTRVRPDGTGGAWLEVESDWGILDWLMGMGAGHPHFTFHSDNFEERGPSLVLRESILS
jgi:hypothetical protein